MNREWTGDLQILDALELLNSTVLTAQWLGISQSSCSRRYRLFSDKHAFQFDRDGSRYKANGNLDVLAGMRKVAQAIRVRQGGLRFVRGWQLGQSPISSLGGLGVEAPVRPISTMEILIMLESRLIDVAVMGLMECQSLIGTSIDRLRLGRHEMGSQLMYIPTCTYELELVARTDNPLVKQKTATSEQIASCPSVGLPLGTAPIMMDQLNQHGLGSELYNHTHYHEDAWEGFANDGSRLSYAAPFNVPGLQRRRQIVPIAYPLGITECLSIVGHKDVIKDNAFGRYFKLLHAETNNIVAVASKSVRWLH